MKAMRMILCGLMMGCLAVLSGSQARAAEVQEKVNLIPNPSFEQPVAGREEQALGWGIYHDGYTRSRDRSYAPETYGHWSIKITGSGEEDEVGLGGASRGITGLPKHGTFIAINHIYIDSFAQGAIRSVFVSVLYTDETIGYFNSTLSDAQIAANLNRWKTYSLTFTTDPEKEIASITYWCIVWTKEEKKFIGTIYFDEPFLGLVEAEAQKAEEVSYPVHFISAAPRIDGRLDEPVWQSLPKAAEFYVLGGGVAIAKQTSFRMGWDKDNLYIGIRCEEPDIGEVKGVLGDGGSLWTEDSLEIFLAPALPDYFQFIVNTIGSRTEAMLGVKDWEAQSYKGKDFWSTEIRVPFTSLGGIPQGGETWRGNIARNITAFTSGGDRHTTWAPLRAALHEPDNFVSFVFSQAKLGNQSARVKAAQVQELRAKVEGYWALPPPPFHPVHQSPFWVEEIGVEPGGTLMLRPRLPYVEGLAVEDYTLVLNFPDALKPSPLRIVATDASYIDLVGLVQEVFREAAPIDGQKRIEWLSRPNVVAVGTGGVNVAILHYWEGMKKGKYPIYKKTISMGGDFDWTRFEAIINTLPNATHIIAMMLKWWDDLTTGDIYFRYFQIQEADTGRVVYEWRSDPPQHLSFDGGRASRAYRFPDTERYQSRIPVRPSQRYRVMVEAKGIDLKPYTSPTDALKSGHPFFTRALVFDVAPDMELPQPLFWKITDGKGRTYREGQVVLTSLPERVAPRQMDTSVWIAETRLRLESLPVQELYISTFHRWGLNTIEPYMEDPSFSFDIPLTDAQVAMPLAAMAKRLGMRVRPYLALFYYDRHISMPYLSAHPEFHATTAQGVKARARILICPTHLLDGGKYESPPRPDIRGGRENPWLGYYLQATERSVRVNQLDGIFFDWEILAAPGNIRAHPRQVESTSCVCARCRRAFQAFMNLEHPPTIEEITGPLYDRYTDFRCRQFMRLWQLFAQAARAANPQATFAIYSGGPDAYSREVYGVDWNIVAPYMDYAMQRQMSPGSLASMKHALDKGLRPGQTRPPLIVQLQVVPYPDMPGFGQFYCDAYERLPNLKNNIVQLVAHSGSTFGWSFNGIWGMDDQMTLPIREANSILARYEDFFVAGNRAPAEAVRVKAGGPAITATWEKDGETVTFVFNRGATPREVTLGRDGFADVQLNVPAHDLVIHHW